MHNSHNPSAGIAQLATVKPAANSKHELGQAPAQGQAGRQKERLIRLPEVMSRCGIGKSLIYALMASKQFPASVRCGGRSVAWLESSIDAWIAARIATQAEQEQPQ